MNVGGRHWIVTRAGDPLIYWGTEFTLLVVGMALVGYALYRSRRCIK
jgi:hypothetical protein